MTSDVEQRLSGVPSEPSSPSRWRGRIVPIVLITAMATMMIAWLALLAWMLLWIVGAV